MISAVNNFLNDNKAKRFLEREKIVHLNKFIIRSRYNKRSLVYEIMETIRIKNGDENL